MKALNISAESMLPVEENLNVEGKEITFKITAFQSGFGSGRKTVVSGEVLRKDTGVLFILDNSDIEVIRRKVSKLLGLKTTSERKPRTTKEQTEVEKLRASFAVARRLSQSNIWANFDVNLLRAAFKRARDIDRTKAQETLKARAVAPILEKVAKLSPEERALLLASLQ